jgi:hypothetical protein
MAKTIDKAAASSSPPEIGRVTNSQGSESVNDITLGEPGVWTVRVIVTPKSGKPIPLDAPVVVESLMSAVVLKLWIIWTAAASTGLALLPPH